MIKRTPTPKRNGKNEAKPVETAISQVHRTLTLRMALTAIKMALTAIRMALTAIKKTPTANVPIRSVPPLRQPHALLIRGMSIRRTPIRRTSQDRNRGRKRKASGIALPPRPVLRTALPLKIALPFRLAPPLSLEPPLQTEPPPGLPPSNADCLRERQSPLRRSCERRGGRKGGWRRDM